MPGDTRCRLLRELLLLAGSQRRTQCCLGELADLLAQDGLEVADRALEDADAVVQPLKDACLDRVGDVEIVP